MTDYLTEQEQIQQIKTWIKQYAPTILLGIALAFILTTGWRYWQDRQNTMLTQASSIYDEMLTLRAQGKTSETLTQAEKITSHYPKTPYAQIAAFMLAREAVLKNNYAEALSQLNWVINHAKERTTKQIARLRSARILLAAKKNQAALDMLKKVDDETYLGLIDEVRGDIYLAMNDTDAARKAYATALKALPNAEVTRPLLKIKLDNLATSS